MAEITPTPDIVVHRLTPQQAARLNDIAGDVFAIRYIPMDLAGLRQKTATVLDGMRRLDVELAETAQVVEDDGTPE